MPAKKKLHETTSTSLNDLIRLIKELQANKEIVQELIHQSPDELKNHRVFCAYTGKINEILKLKIHTERMDPFRLLSEVLQTVAVYLAENNEVSAAHCIGNHVEDIEEKVIKQWWDYQEYGNKDLNGQQEKELEKVLNPSKKGGQNKKKDIKKKR